MAQLVEQSHTAPEIISLERAKKQCRFDEPDQPHLEDDLVQMYVDAAIGYAETFTNLEISQKRFLIKGKSFEDALAFSKQKILQINSIQYKDVNGNTQTIAADKYQIKTVSRLETEIEFAEDFEFPEVKPYTFDAVKVDVVVGYAEGKVPKNMQIALLMLVGHYYENRQDVVKQKCTAAENMLIKYRNH